MKGWEQFTGTPLGSLEQMLTGLPTQVREGLAMGLLGSLPSEASSLVYAWNTAKGFASKALQAGVSLEGARVLEMGAGQALATGVFWNMLGASCYNAVDKFVSQDVSPDYLQRLQSFTSLLLGLNGVGFNTLVQQGDGSPSIDQNRVKLVQAAIADVEFPDPFDVVYSLAVLEHVDDVPGALKCLNRALKPGGITIHTIDLREHYTPHRGGFDKDKSIEFLKYSKEEWESAYPPGSEHYINRLRTGDFRRMFEDAGFDIEHWYINKTLDMNESIYGLVHKEFGHYSLEDMNALGVNVVARKRS